MPIALIYRATTIRHRLPDRCFFPPPSNRESREEGFLLLLLHHGRRDLAAGPVLDVYLLAPADAAPLLLIGLLVDRVGRDLGRLFILNLLGKHQVQDQGQEGGDGEAGLEDEHDGVVEAQEGVVVAAVGEDVAEPAAMKLLTKISVGVLGLQGWWCLLGDESRAEPETEASSQDETRAASERDGGHNADTGDGHGAEEEGRHAA